MKTINKTLLTLALTATLGLAGLANAMYFPIDQGDNGKYAYSGEGVGATDGVTAGAKQVSPNRPFDEKMDVYTVKGAQGQDWLALTTYQWQQVQDLQKQGKVETFHLMKTIKLNQPDGAMGQKLYVIDKIKTTDKFTADDQRGLGWIPWNRH